MACATLLLVSVEAAAMLGQPFPKRRAFHRLSPVPDSSREKPRASLLSIHMPMADRHLP
jgi:hypothetical protein